ncbi:aminotransferase class I/II-fold pyridoxal phosphate-dependent enzyme, partial [Rhizobium leguminosarum]|uniref:aminotransferase class I/II-fold pyridoxal phosphate-dependent enzyme n=1 Tax=Rhizobium leguminosarum TaxID=384 RepID=UPI001A8D9414
SHNSELSVLPSIERIFDIERQFLKQHKRLPVSASDWHLNGDPHYVPTINLEGTSSQLGTSLSAYLFADSREKEKERVINYMIETQNIFVDRESVSIYHNATSAIFALLKIVTSRKRSRVLVQSPCYFSIYSALDIIGLQPILYRSKAVDNFVIDPGDLLETAREQAIDLIIFTDPLYCVGTDNKNAILSVLPRLSDLGIACIIDSSAGGFGPNGAPVWIDGQYIKPAMDYDLCFYVDSPTKKLLINSEKHALIFGNSKILAEVEGYSDHFSGSFSRGQLQTLHWLYDTANGSELSRCQSGNIGIIEKHDLLLSALADEFTNIKKFKRSQGSYSTIQNTALVQQDIDPFALYKTLLDEKDVRLLPGHLFGFSQGEGVSVRINLFRHPSVLKAAVKALSEFNLYLGQRA